MIPRIAIITPYYQESESILEQCHCSVKNQQGNFKADHFLIADGHPLEAINKWQCLHSILHKSHDDNGNTPRAIGCTLAEKEKYDFIAFLDADNWFHDNHLNSLLETHAKTRRAVISCFRTYHLPDGQQLSIQEADENNLQHIDTSCLLLEKRAFALNQIWSAMPKELSPICDRIFRAGLSHHRYPFASTGLRSVAFRTQYKNHYLQAGLQPPNDAKSHEATDPSNQFMMTPKGISECIRTLGFWPITYLRN